MKFLRLVAMLPILSALVVGCSSTETFNASTPEGAFKQAESLEKDDRFEEAVQRYSEVRNRYPYSRLATEAELRIADLHFKREAYTEAASSYQLFKEFHPKHPRIDYVTYRLGLSYFNELPPTIDRDLSIADKAILYFDEVLNSYPNSEFAAQAKEKKQETLKKLAQKEIYIANFYAKKDQFDSALRRYETVLRKFPNLGYDSEALFGAAKSALRSGEKERGEQHLKNLYSLFPSSDEAKRARNEFESVRAE